ncbi:hypothetical protein VDP25_17075 [Winogradskyella sp. ECml5-4]|uniref:hypothetical protein n=1 Tax=Winogradskyella sp. ECml5-4 TaxID=3110975 RepID=UPI002FF16E98
MTNKNFELDYQKEIAKIHYYSQDATSDFNAVIETSKRLIENGFDDSQLNFYVGRAYQELNQNKLAIEFYKKSISANDPHSNWTKELSSNNLGNLYFNIDLYDDCIDICKYNINYAKNDLYKANALYLTAHSHYLKTFELTEISPDYPFELCEGLEKTEVNILKALELQPENIDYIVLAGVMYKRGIKANYSFKCLSGDCNVKARYYLTKAANLGDYQAKELLNQL